MTNKEAEAAMDACRERHEAARVVLNQVFGEMQATDRPSEQLWSRWKAGSKEEKAAWLAYVSARDAWVETLP